MATMLPPFNDAGGMKRASRFIRFSGTRSHTVSPPAMNVISSSKGSRGKRVLAAYFTFALILTMEVPTPSGPRPVNETANSSVPLNPAFAL